MLTLGHYSENSRIIDYGRYNAPLFKHHGYGRHRSCGEAALVELTGECYTEEEYTRHPKILRRPEMVKILRSNYCHHQSHRRCSLLA